MRKKAPLVFASDRRCYDSYVETDGMIVYNNTPFGRLTGELSGSCQLLNAATIITALEVLRKKELNFLMPMFSAGLQTCAALPVWPGGG